MCELPLLLALLLLLLLLLCRKWSNPRLSCECQT
jgi:hypothetical protein